jgi:hypothetical protein
LLSCHRIEESVSLAENAGLFRLATLLSQLDGDISLSYLLQNQLKLWYDTDGESTIPTDLLKIYKLLGASPLNSIDDDISESNNSKSILIGLGWIRCFAVMFWYCGSLSNLSDNVPYISLLIENFKVALKDGQVDVPSSPFCEDKSEAADVSYPSTKNGLFRLANKLLLLL